MKRVLALFIIAMITVAFLEGCQQTPDEAIVVQKDMEQMIEKATVEDETQQSFSLAEFLNTPEIYTASFNAYSGDLTVHAQAPVTVPDANGISVTRIGRHEFTQEEADKMMDVFLDGATLYELDYRLTKAEIQEKLVEYYAMRDGAIPINLDGENPKDADKLQQVIEHYEELLAGAPETKEPVPADTSFHTPDTVINPDAQIIEGTADVNGKAAYLFINNGFFDRNNIEAIFINAKPNMEGSYDRCPYSVLSEEDLADVEVSENLKMTITEAQSAADNIIARLGITGMTCVDIGYAVMSEEIASGTAVAEPGTVIKPEQWESGNWAYSLQYQRTINGIPMTLTNHSGNYVSDENYMSEPWPYERLNIIVDETGVVYFEYLSPCGVQDTVTEDAALKQFADIISVFEKMFPITYGYLNDEGTDYRLQVEISEVRLGLMRITEQDRRDTGLLIPVWDFFGDITVVPPEGDPYIFTSGSLFTINAIDGSVIDRKLGY